MNKKAVIDFYFDVISPYSWIGFEAMLRYKPILPADINFKPFFVAAVMHEVGNSSPAYNQVKQRYSRNDIDKLNRYWGLNISFSDDYVPVVMQNGSLTAQRFLTAVEKTNPSHLVQVARALSARVFVEHLPIYRGEDLVQVGQQQGLPDIENILKLSQTDEIKKVLKRRTADAVESGGFGAPWIVLKRQNRENVSYFGGDRLPLICFELGVDFKGPNV